MGASAPFFYMDAPSRFSGTKKTGTAKRDRKTLINKGESRNPGNPGKNGRVPGEVENFQRKTRKPSFYKTFSMYLAKIE